MNSYVIFYILILTTHFLCILLHSAKGVDATWAQSINSSTPQGFSTLRPTVERVFSRKKRFLLMPKGSHTKFTCVMSKHLVSSFPKGFNFRTEAALYYPSVTARIDAIPKRFRPKTTPAPKPKPTKEPLLVHIPGSLIKYKAKPAAKPKKVQRIDNGPVQWIDTNGTKWSKTNWSNYNWEAKRPNRTTTTYQYQRQPTPTTSGQAKWSKWSGYGTQDRDWSTSKWANWPSDTHHWSSAATNTSNYDYTRSPPWRSQSSQPQRRTEQSSYYHTDTSSWPRRSRWRRSVHSRPVDYIDEEMAEKNIELADVKLTHFPDLEPFEEWKHYHSYRDRRQLFHSLEGFDKILGFDMKICILRAICESKRFLLPPGYSMIHDILRLIFTFPTVSGLQDDFSRVMQTDAESCAHYWRAGCPFSILDFLLNSNKQ